MTKIISSAILVDNLGLRRCHTDLHVAISHRSYLLNDGGIEHCLRRESQAAKLLGVDYLHICPAKNLASGGSFTSFVEIYLNDDYVGITSLDGFVAKLCVLKPDISFLHSALGFNPHCLIRLLLNLRRCGPIVEWVHDLSFACESVTLIRNGESCGVPALGAIGCLGCTYNETRETVVAHYDLIERLSDCQIFPSFSAQQRYNASIAGRGRTSLRQQFVLPHYVVNCSASKPGQLMFRNVNYPVGVAFFGHSVMHKGWSEYIQLVHALSGNTAYRFYHIGSAGQTDSRVERVDFTEAFARPHSNSLQDICSARGIKIAFFWPVALESFGLMLRQALGAGCAILCADNNDAQREFINGCDQIRYFSKVDQLIAWFGDEKEVAALLHQTDITDCQLKPTACSYELITKKNDTWQLLNLATPDRLLK